MNEKWKINIIIAFLIAVSCTNERFPVSEFSPSQLKEAQIIITKFRSDSIFMIQDSSHIAELFLILAASRKEACKFSPHYIIAIENKKLSLNTHWIKYKGTTYKSDRNLEQFIKQNYTSKQIPVLAPQK